MITDAVRNGEWLPMKLSRDGPKISHLFFADDVLLFTKAIVSQAMLVKRGVDNFCGVSRLRINIAKSKMFASLGVKRSRRLRLTQVMNMHFTTHIDKYLGFKMFNGRITKASFGDVIDRVTSKLASWKGRLLNKPGRLTLTNAVLSSIPSYGMQIQWFPQNVCDHLDRISQDFFWRGTSNRGMNLVKWSVVTLPKKNGGLGVRTSRLQNIALLGKLVWDMLHQPDKLWVSIFSSIYVRNGNLFANNFVRDSPVWNSLVKALNLLQNGFNFKFGNGNTSLWFKPWVLKGSLNEAIWAVDIRDSHLRILFIVFHQLVRSVELWRKLLFIVFLLVFVQRKFGAIV